NLYVGDGNYYAGDNTVSKYVHSALDSFAGSTFTSKEVGTHPVNLAGLVLKGLQAGDYALAPVPPMTVTGRIRPRTLTVSGISADKVYDGTTLAALDTNKAALAGVVGADDVTLDPAGATATFPSKDVTNSASVRISGLKLGGKQARD